MINRMIYILKGKGMVISTLLICLFALLPLSAQTVKNIAVSGDNAYTDHISLEGDVTDKDIMVKFVFDEAANQLTVSLISHRMIFVFREDVRFKPLFKGRKLRPDQLPYVVTYDPTDKYKISKLFKSTDSFNYRIAQIYDRMSGSRYLPTVRLLHEEGWLTDEEVSHVEAFDL